MAGQRIIINGSVAYIDYADAEGSATVNGRVWRWSFHEYCGPSWLRKDHSERKCQNPTIKAVWDAFEAWHRGYEKEKQQAKAEQNV